MHELGEAAKAVGQYETGRDVDLGLTTILDEKKAAAQVAFDSYMKTVMMQGERAGIATQQGNLPLN